jgi:hypothetical protein
MGIVLQEQCNVPGLIYKIFIAHKRQEKPGAVILGTVSISSRVFCQYNAERKREAFP